MMSILMLTALIAASAGQAENLTILEVGNKAGLNLEKLESQDYRNIKLDRSLIKVADGIQGVAGNDIALGQAIENLKTSYSIPFGSVTKTVTKDTQKVLSVAYKADIEDRAIKLPSDLVDAGEKVRLNKEVLKDVKDYVIYLDNEALVAKLREKGLDLSLSGLKFSVDSNGKLNAIERCYENSCETALIFDVVNLTALENGKLKTGQKLALNIENQSIFDSAIALQEKGMTEELKHEQAHQNQERNERTNLFLQKLTSANDVVFKVSTVGATMGSVEDVVCSSTGKAVVLSSDLSKVLAQSENGTGLRVVQRTDGSKAPEGFVEVAVDGSDVTGLVAKDQLRPQSQCGYISQNGVGSNSLVQNASFGSGVLKATEADVAEANLLSAGPLHFPTIKRPTQSYRSGMRAFGARRGGGSRKHAACDLYRSKNEKTVAVEAGKVIQGPYFFYQGTYAREVKLNSGPVIRYGEITSKKSGIATGSFSAGELIGYVGKTHCCTPMLHFEKFSGAKRGSLSGGGKYRRRSDLQDPTAYLRKLEKIQFGKSY